MERKIAIKLDGKTLTFENNAAARQRVFDIMLASFIQLNHFDSESLGQSDDTYIEAANILGEVAEEGFKFEVKWDNE